MIYILSVLSIFIAMGLVFGFIMIDSIRNKVLMVKDFCIWLLWFALVMAIVTC